MPVERQPLVLWPEECLQVLILSPDHREVGIAFLHERKLSHASTGFSKMSVGTA